MSDLEEWMCYLILFSLVVKHSFKVTNKRIIAHHSYILQANDEQDKHHWLQCLQSAIQNHPATLADDSMSTRNSVGRGASFSFRDEPFSLEDANSSIGSLSSLVSVFSTDSTQSGMNTRLRVRAVAKKSEGDEDSGIVSWWKHSEESRLVDYLETVWIHLQCRFSDLTWCYISRHLLFLNWKFSRFSKILIS